MKLKFEHYLGRQRMSTEQFVKLKNIGDYVALCDYLQSIGIGKPNEEEVKHVFAKSTNTLEERAVVDEKKVGSERASTRSRRSRSTKTTRKGTGRRAKPKTKNVDTPQA